jgi:hypothetical protein
MKSNPKPRSRRPKANRSRNRAHGDEPDEPLDTNPERVDPPDEPTDLDFNSLDPNDTHWDVFLFDDELDRDPRPESGDFWLPD